MDITTGAVCYRKITISGVVQGVGFRPFVLRTAVKLGIAGSVYNRGGLVVVEAAGAQSTMTEFIDKLASAVPTGAWIADIKVEDICPFAADEFTISSSSTEASAAFISPDISICDSCLKEIQDPTNMRFLHPFNSCVDCGPRFSILQKLPYDREHTSMSKFPLCESCDNEYSEAENRRCHAQTVCCNHCGPKLSLKLKNGDSVDGDLAVESTVKLLENGGIVAIKGVGGYHLACIPHDRQALIALRKLKGREAKPFAVMFRSLDDVKKVCYVSEHEAELLQSSSSPITLLDMKNASFPSELLGGSLRCGCFLPYTALHHLLLENLGAMVLTSANIGGAAIITDDSEIAELMRQSDLLCGVLTHNREIIRAAEDSVVQVVAGSTQLMRRSRGYAPAAVPLAHMGVQNILAMGGDLKSAFCLASGGYAYQSQYFGDLEEYSVFQRYKSSIADLSELLHIQPELVLCDKHPAYFSSELAGELELPVVPVQHHHAHIASVMTEHALNEKVIGVAFDGTGYGDDGSIWGGEFLLCHRGNYRRVGHLAQSKLIGGDTAARDAKKTALSYLWNSDIKELNNLDSYSEILVAALENSINTVQSSSMGRLFDAVAAILNIADYNRYEGECAVLLQQCAEEAKSAQPLDFTVNEQEGIFVADWRKLICQLVSHKGKIDAGALARGFHLGVAEMTAEMCCKIGEAESCRTVALSGGVFQNRLLVELTMQKLEACGFKVYINRMSAPNDGGIALGQAYIGGFISCV